MATEDKPKFTPGPWQRSGIRGRETIYGHAVGPDADPVVIVPYSDRHHAECMANAALIAAAPDMYEALKMAQLWLDIDGRYDMRTINAAIKKAEGRQS